MFLIKLKLTSSIPVEFDIFWPSWLVFPTVSPPTDDGNQYHLLHSPGRSPSEPFADVNGEFLIPLPKNQQWNFPKRLDNHTLTGLMSVGKFQVNDQVWQFDPVCFFAGFSSGSTSYY